jgi:hypothetical protein
MLKTQSSFHIVVLKTCDHPWNQLNFRMYVLEYEMTSLKSLCTYYTCSLWKIDPQYFIFSLICKVSKPKVLFLLLSCASLSLKKKKNLNGEGFHRSWFIYPCVNFHAISLRWNSLSSKGKECLSLHMKQYMKVLSTSTFIRRMYTTWQTPKGKECWCLHMKQ